MILALAITGPTASGKTALSIETARVLGCEIISMDSMQIYKGMDIGTAKASKAERALIPHHMLDILSPDMPFSAKAYSEEALKCARDICKRGKTPLFVGGTGLYLSTLMRPDVEEAPESNPEYRKTLEISLKTEEDRIALWKRLEAIDPEAAHSVHFNNTRRVIRALEIFDTTGKTKTYFDGLTKQKNEQIELKHVTLDFHNRDILYERIDKRVEVMLRDGLIEEVKDLLRHGFLSEDTTSSQAIGYKEIINALKNKLDPESAVDEIKQASRNYAKRQLTWFRHMQDATIIYTDFENGKLKSQDILLNECITAFQDDK